MNHLFNGLLIVVSGFALCLSFQSDESPSNSADVDELNKQTKAVIANYQPDKIVKKTQCAKNPAVAEDSPRPTNKYYGKNYPKLIVFVPSIEPGTANKESEQFKIDWAWGKFNNVAIAIYFCESENTLIEDVEVSKDEIEYPLFWIEGTEEYIEGYKNPQRMCQWLRKNIPPVVAEEPPYNKPETKEAWISVTLSESTFEHWKIANGVDGYVGTLGNNRPMDIQPALERDLNGTKRTRDIVILEADKSDRYILVIRLIPWPAVAESK